MYSFNESDLMIGLKIILKLQGVVFVCLEMVRLSLAILLLVITRTMNNRFNDAVRPYNEEILAA